MRQIKKKEFVRSMERALYRAHFSLRPDVRSYFEEIKEKSPSQAKEIVSFYQENADIAQEEHRALCQDSGYVQVYLYVGRVCFDFPLQQTIDEVVACFYQENHLRCSLAHPLTRENTQTNTPVFLTTEWVDKDGLDVMILIKGGGSENVTRYSLFLPTENLETIENWIVEEMKSIGSKGCPPYLMGLCIGGTVEKALSYSKQMLLKPRGFISSDILERRVAEDLKRRLNELSVGFQGLGFGETVMDVFVKILPCHIATLPVAFSLGCNSVRQAHFSL